MPATAERVSAQLGFELHREPGWETWGQLHAGTTIGAVEPLFPRIDRDAG